MTQSPSGGTTPRTPRGRSDGKARVSDLRLRSNYEPGTSRWATRRAQWRAIEAAGGIGFEVRTAAPSDFIHSAGHRGGYILSARDLITNDIEMQVEGAQLVGMICLASCDKTAPGQLMAAARLNIPTIIVACGYQASGAYRGRHCDIEDAFLAANPPPRPAEVGWLSVYQRLVRPLPEGAVLRPRPKESA